VAVELASLPLFVPILILGFDLSEIPARVWGLVIASAVIHAFYGYWLSRAYAHTELSVAYPIVRSTPAFVPFIAVPFLGESVSLLGGLGIALVVASLWIVTTDGHRGAAAFRSRGALIAYLALATTVGYSLVDKEAMRILAEGPWSGRLPRAVAFMALMWILYLPLFLALARRSIPTADVIRVVRTRAVVVIASGLIAFVSYALVLHAMQTASVSYITAVRQSSILFALAIAVMVLRERPGRLRVLGGVLNVAGVALIAFSR
jgi:drug/metabolite transporter (DMT)-like permease